MDPWETIAEDHLLVGSPKERTITLAGSFDGSRFDGYISGTPRGASATLGG